jgi:hypothetical protein
MAADGALALVTSKADGAILSKGAARRAADIAGNDGSRRAMISRVESGIVWSEMFLVMAFQVRVATMAAGCKSRMV